MTMTKIIVGDLRINCFFLNYIFMKKNEFKLLYTNYIKEM